MSVNPSPLLRVILSPPQSQPSLLAIALFDIRIARGSDNCRRSAVVFCRRVAIRLRGLGECGSKQIAHSRPELWPFQSIRKIGGEKADLRPAVKTLSRKFITPKILLLRESDHRVG